MPLVMYEDFLDVSVKQLFNIIKPNFPRSDNVWYAKNQT